MAVGIGGELGWYCPSLNDSPNDLSGNGNDGTYNGGMGTVADTEAGGSLAYEFDGTDDYIDTPFILNPASQDFSYSCWSALDLTASNVAIMIQQLGSNGRGWMYREGTDLRSFVGGVATISSSRFTPEWDGVFRHFALVYSGTSLTLYISGTDVVSATVTAESEPTGGMRIGANKTGGSCWKGLMDDIRIFNRAITQDEITALATKRGYQPSTTTPSVFFHPLSQGF